MNVEKKSKAASVICKVDIKSLPDISTLNKKVQRVVDSSSWWELYGADWLIVISALSLFPVSLVLLRQSSLLLVVSGMVLYGCIHGVLTTKSGHSAAHGAVVRSPKWNKFWSHVFLEFTGSFSAQLAYDIHVSGHHPHTNIIGLGDSAMWKVPSLPKYIYMFVAPLLVPILTPFFALGQFGKLGRKQATLSLMVICSGLALQFSLVMYISGYTLPGTVLIVFSSRAVLSIPYIHVNIFQHIGLPMYSQENRPKRIYQMSTGVLNLSRNPLLDLCFGNSIISCHVEHHLYPRLSDNMLLRIKPIVREFLLGHNLPYNEDTYVGRLYLFVKKYEDLMVHPPPITHFIGIQ